MASPIELKIVRDTNNTTTTYTEEIILVHTYNPQPGNGIDDITESIPLQIEGSKATARATITSINNMLDTARFRNEKGYGDKIYLMTRTGGTAESWRRSPILDGRLSVTDDGVIAGLASNSRTPTTLTVTRGGYFEDHTVLNVPFYNSNGTMSADWISFYNCNSGAGTAPNKLNNYGIVNAASISGDLPAPLLVGLTNTGGTVNRYIVSLVAVGGNGTANPDYFFKDFSGTADASCSGGSAAVYTLSSAAEADMFTANIYGAGPFLQLGGAPYHVIARFANNTSLANVKFRLKFQSGTTTIWQGPQFALSSTDIIQDLGVINLPPGQSHTWGDGNVVISGQRTTGSSETIKLDFLQFLGGTYASLKGIVPITGTDSLSYGGNNKTIYRVSSSLPRTDWIAYGADALMLQPGKSNLFQILSQSSTPGTAAINYETQVEIWYRPRWSSL